MRDWTPQQQHKFVEFVHDLFGQWMFGDDPGSSGIVCPPADPCTEPSSSVTASSAKSCADFCSHGWIVTYSMSDYVQQSVEHYKTLSGIECIKNSSTPYVPDGSLHPDNDQDRGQLGDQAASILMKILWAARLARPDLA